MIQKLSGMVLCAFRYNDAKNIVHIYTEQNGRMSFLVPASRSKKSAVNGGIFQALSLVEFEAEIKPRATIHPIKEARLLQPLVTIPYNPYKSGIAMFIAEFLSKALKEEGRSGPLYSYIFNSVLWLDACEKGFANFHLVFLMRLSRFLGLYPNVEGYAEGAYFDLLNACFTTKQPLHGMYVRPDEAARIVNLMRMRYETMHLFAMNRNERNRCLDIINEYYGLHLPDFHEMKSLPVLKELFG